MARVFDSISQCIGSTPLVRLNKLAAPKGANVLVKLESQNPTGSVKCRAAAKMVLDAEQKKLLTIGSKEITVIESTSGNTGIGLAFICAVRGYPLVITMPEAASIERRQIMASYGAKIILTDGKMGMNGAIDKVKELIANDPKHYFYADQFNNPSNPEAHFNTTAPEIFNDTNGKTDILVSSVGSGGTLTGIAEYFKEYKKQMLYTVAVEPASSAVLTAARAKKKPKIGHHQIQGIGAGFIPSVLRLDLIDEVVAVSDAEAFEYTKRMCKEEAISCGISGGAAVCAALKLANRPENKGKNIVVILPDSVEKYLSTALFI